MPDGTFYEYHATTMGARSQSARTYLERNFTSFPDGEGRRSSLFWGMSCCSLVVDRGFFARSVLLGLMPSSCDGLLSPSSSAPLEPTLVSGCRCTAALDDMIRHGLLAIKDTLGEGVELSKSNVSIGVVGKGRELSCPPRPSPSSPTTPRQSKGSDPGRFPRWFLLVFSRRHDCLRRRRCRPLPCPPPPLLFGRRRPSRPGSPR